MVEEFRKAPVENMDEVIYYVNGTYRLLEFLVSVTINVPYPGTPITETSLYTLQNPKVTLP